MAFKTCPCGCGEPVIPHKGKGRPRKYATRACAKRAADRRRAARLKYERKEAQEIDARLKADAVKGHPNSEGRDNTARGGALYEAFVSSGLMEDYRAGRIDQRSVAEEMGVDQSTISRWVMQAKKDARAAEIAANWEPPERLQALLEDDPEAFRQFYLHMKPTDRRGKPTIVKDFHIEWIALMFDAYLNGGQVGILAPQRHGKSELLVAFCCWLIIKNPNISILWVASTTDLAKKAVNNVRVQLENNERVREFLPPGKTYKPATTRGSSETSMPWTSEEFTVATRTVWHKSPTMAAIGSGGTLLSRDADMIVADDIVDHKKVHQAGMREKIIEWWSTDLTSRIEEHTAAVYIGSRQHPEDLTQWLDTNPEWNVRTWSAHDPACGEPWDALDDDTGPAFPEKHVDCMLFPEVRSFRWLWGIRRSIGSQRLFDLRYNNILVATDEAVFDREALEGCYDKMRLMGQVPPGYRLIAGFDPGGGSGFQAAVLWAVRPADGHRVLVDIENKRGGGIAHMRDLLSRWSEQYRELGVWVFEMNILKDTLDADKEIREIKGRHNLSFVPHKTNTNKWDRRIGIWSMVQMYADRNVVIPYGDTASREKAREFVNQHARFEPEQAHSKSNPFDLVMAAWFPQLTVSRWLARPEPTGNMDNTRGRTPYPSKGRRRLLKAARRGTEVVGVVRP